MHRYIFLISCFFILSCTISKSSKTSEEPTCHVEAKVLDYTGLDGCRFLLELKDGHRLLPISLPDSEFLFSEGQLVKISYTIKKEMLTACMTSADPAEITCITQIKAGEKPGQVFLKRICSDTEAPLSLAWVKKQVMRNNVAEIKRGYRGGTPYYFMYGDTHVQVYSCLGDLVCEYLKKTKNTPCEEKMSQYTDVQSVWALK